MSITDATACIGGNSISFCKYFSHVNMIEINKKRVKMLRHNVSACYKHKTFGKDMKATYKISNGDYLNVLHENKDIQKDIIFFDPPWGGLDYKKHNKLMPEINNDTITDIVHKMCEDIHFKFVVLKLPVNFDLDSFSINKNQILFNEDLKNNKESQNEINYC